MYHDNQRLKELMRVELMLVEIMTELLESTSSFILRVSLIEMFLINDELNKSIFAIFVVAMLKFRTLT